MINKPKTQRVKIDSTEFQPLNEFILVDPNNLQKEEELESGIIVINDYSVTDRPTSGTVLSVGSDIKDIKVGGYVLWPNTDGIDIEFDDGVKVLLRYKSIIGTRK